MTARIGLGLVGAGRMGSVHARLVAAGIPGARLAGIADIDLDAARRLAAEVGDPPAYGSIDELLAAPGLDAVLIAVSSSRHLEVIQAAAGAGKDILCEKPIALTIADTDAAIEAVERAGVRLQVGFMRRWDPDYARAHARIASGRYGRPILFTSLQFDVEPPPLAFADPAVSGGIMLDMGIHEFDLARWLMADEVVEVHAYGGSIVSPEIAALGDGDSAVVGLRFAGGALGTVQLARTTTYGEDVRTEVLLTNGSAWIGTLPTTMGASSGGRAKTSASWTGAVEVDTLDPTTPRFAHAYAEQTRGFVEAVANDRPVAVPANEGRAALRIALAADRSMHERRPVAVTAG
jgi:predicted dehydrogenase